MLRRLSLAVLLAGASLCAMEEERVATTESNEPNLVKKWMKSLFGSNSNIALPCPAEEADEIENNQEEREEEKLDNQEQEAAHMHSDPIPIPGSSWGDHGAEFPCQRGSAYSWEFDSDH